MKLFIIGIDPGQTVGIAGLYIHDAYDSESALLTQCTQPVITGRSCVEPLLLTQCKASEVEEELNHAWSRARLLAPWRPIPEALAVERFVVSTRAGKSRYASAGATTRSVYEQAVAWGSSRGLAVHPRSASAVKPWATDRRLAAAGLLTKGLRHARDAARHALFSAVRDYDATDPLSNRARAA